MTGSAGRGVSSTVGTVLLVATVMLVSATVAAFATGDADELREPSLAAVEAESTTVDFGGGGDIALCPGDPAVFEFYAETDGQTTILQRLEL